ncbi:MAG: type II and III secretion system protein [Bacteroidetes bacterium]|nr:type II and III secretion system protein [Bacteroidota bacterium]MCL6099284.1 type II and III secretion system protein [Bacteroidota bacterium]
MKKIITFLFLLSSVQLIFAQIDLKDKLKGYVSPEEIVSLSEKIPFNQAIEILSKVSEKVAGKKIVSTVDSNSPIGIEIVNMQYKKALFIIVQYNNLTVDETGPSIVVRKKDETAQTKLEKDVYAPITEREVKISAVLFEANVDDMRERGINWEFLLSQSGVQLGSKIVTLQEPQQQTGTQTQAQQKPPTYEINTKSNYSLGPWDGTATGLLRAFETNGLGEIIARPTIIARNGIPGKTQVGNDFSIKERDFAGNLIDKFYPTGTIIEVTPYVYKEDGINYILLKLRIERSSVVSRDALSTNVSKNTINTDVLLLNGEETAVGGLFENQELNTRRGIPFLKDLPWWVFGLRYIFGYDQTENVRKEIIMLIKADILPTLKERIKMEKSDSVLRDERARNMELMEKYKEQLKKSEGDIEKK